jgi:hypothetical protein
MYVVNGLPNIQWLGDVEEKDAMCHQVFQGSSYNLISMFGWSTKVADKCAAQNQDVLKSQDVGRSAAFWLSDLLYSIVSFLWSIAFPLFTRSHSPLFLVRGHYTIDYFDENH